LSLADFSFVDHAQTLRLDCRVADGWRQSKKSYCFYEKLPPIPWRDDITIAAWPSVFPHPISLSPLASTFLGFGKFDGKEGGISYLLRDRSLQLDVKLLIGPQVVNPQLPWDENSKGKPRVRWAKSLDTGDILNIGRKECFSLGLLLVLEPAPGRPAPIVRDWFRRFYPGGLPSLGKKR
jgi:hypothetical protein